MAGGNDLRVVHYTPAHLALSPGTTLGPYEILGALGAGGMGEVYRARDSKLGRSVAIKVLPEAFAADPDRVPRFEREAKVLASLNHPHIAALYGMERVPGQPPVHFLIMEMVEGETLFERLQRGALSVGDTLAIGIQIADALESAHEQGIVHRDLKPANVKITPDDNVKVLDFGLAKAMDRSPAASSPANSPTLSVLATRAGMIMGTAAYMSPEQAKGAATDRRSDVFSFGVVLYEMLSGRQPFRGDTAAEIMASVMLHEADLAALPAGLNTRITELIKRCLEKNPKKRWQAMGDLRVELETLAMAPPASALAVPGATAPVPLWRRALPLAAAVVAMAVVIALASRWLTTPSPREVVRFAVTAPNFNPGFQNVALSPDGSRLVYVIDTGLGQRQMMLRMIGDLEARPIAGAEGLVSSPSFSPDGQFIAFYAGHDGTIKKIAITGGAAVTLCKAVVPYSGPHWSPLGILLGQPSGVLRVSADGGESELVIPLKKDERITSPQYIDDRGSILFAMTTGPLSVGWGKGQIFVQSPDGSRQLVVSGGSDPRYLPSGHLMYVSGTTLLAQPFDRATRRVLGVPTPVVEGISRGTSQLFAAHYAVSESGSFAYVPAVAAANQAPRTLALVDLNGKVQPVAAPPGAYTHPRVSPDGTRVAVATEDEKESAIWIFELSRASLPRRLTFDGRNAAPIWTPDGQFITFQSSREGDGGLFQQRADGTGTAERLTKAEPTTLHFPGSWSPNGTTLTFRVAAEFSSIWTWSREGDGKPRRLVPGNRSQASGEFSPEGRWLAYGSNELDASRYQLFVQPYPPTGAKYQVSAMTASTPVWSRDGRRLFFTSDDRIYGADIQTVPAFTVSQPIEFKMRGILSSLPTMRQFDLMPDGKHLLVVLPVGSDPAPAATQINVVVNGLDELKAKVRVR